MPTVTQYINANADDGYGNSFSTFSASATEAYFGAEGATAYRSFHRFSGVAIPAGATIYSAKIQLRARGSLPGTTVNVKVHCEAADSPSAPSSYSDLTGRSLTSGAAWNNVGAWTIGNWYDSIDFTSDLQAVIDRAGWVENNAVTVHIVNNASSGAAAYRNPGTRDYSTDYAARLVVSFSAVGTIADTSGASDSSDAFSLTDSISDASGFADSSEGYDFNGNIADAAGHGDIADSLIESGRSSLDTLGAADAAAAAAEIQAALSDASGWSDASDGFNWSLWFRQNRDISVIRYYCTLTGANDGTTDVEIPITSFQARKQNGESTYLSVVVPGMAYAQQITDRANGEIVIEMAYLLAGVESVREEILRVELEDISPQIGPYNRSITLSGHKTTTWDTRAASIQGANYKYQSDGLLGFRFPQADPYLQPGDTLTVVDTGDVFTVDYVTYAISASGAKFMEVREG